VLIADDLPNILRLGQNMADPPLIRLTGIGKVIKIDQVFLRKICGDN
jgi:hypothetical protein